MPRVGHRTHRADRVILGQGYGQADQVRLWFNARPLEKLRLEDTNDAKYLMGDPRREVWVGPSVDASSGGIAVKERWYRN